MSFHQLAVLPSGAQAALADTCEALITAEGTEVATPRERQLLEEIYPALVGVPWPSGASPRLPAGLRPPSPRTCSGEPQRWARSGIFTGISGPGSSAPWRRCVVT